MPLYCFHLRDGEGVLLDPNGRELSDLDAVVACALAEARSLISHEVISGEIHLDQRIDVEDASGQVVHSLHFSDAVRIFGRGPSG